MVGQLGPCPTRYSQHQSHSSPCIDLHSTHKLELAEVGEVENGDGAFWGIDLSLGECDELEMISIYFV
jgi:hypothetical protein